MQQCESAISWKAHDGEVYSVEFSYDENTVYSVGEDRKVEHTHTHSVTHTHTHSIRYSHKSVCVCVCSLSSGTSTAVA